MKCDHDWYYANLSHHYRCHKCSKQRHKQPRKYLIAQYRKLEEERQKLADRIHTLELDLRQAKDKLPPQGTMVRVESLHQLATRLLTNLLDLRKTCGEVASDEVCFGSPRDLARSLSVAITKMIDFVHDEAKRLGVIDK